jgi:hypothetical protein
MSNREGGARMSRSARDKVCARGRMREREKWR